MRIFPSDQLTCSHLRLTRSLGSRKPEIRARADDEPALLHEMRLQARQRPGFGL